MVTEKSILARIAVAATDGMSVDVVHRMIELNISPEDYIAMSIGEFNTLVGINPAATISEAKRKMAVARAEQEFQFVKAHNIRTLYIGDEDYPVLLREAPDAPVLLFVLGSLDFNAQECISIVGTRRCTQYGTNFCNTIVEDIKNQYPNRPAIISGLAYGIDAAAHRAALNHSFPTVAVLAHGLDMIYPAAHRLLAKEILNSGGGLVTEYFGGVRPFKRRFLERNRIVAAMSAATIVVESEIKGGAMSTASTAFSYDREVMALPGRISDCASAGCNYLIKKEKARIITEASDLGELLGWNSTIQNKPSAPTLFPELEGDALPIMETLRNAGGEATIDLLHVRTSLPVYKISSILSELEFEGLVTRLPGNRYSIL